MRCDAIQNDILNLPDPRQVSGELREHLDACPACHAWWQGVRKLESLVERLPVPASSASRRSEFLAELQGSAVILDRPLVRTREAFFTRRRVYTLAGLAASVAIVLGALSLVRGPGGSTVQAQTPPHPFLDRVVQRNIAIAKSSTPADRLSALGLLVDDVHQEARDVARVAPVEDLKTLAGWYDKLVREGLVTQAEKLPNLDPAAKATLLRDLAGKLGTASEDAERLSAEVPPTAQESIRRMAETARVGQQKLRQLAGGA